MGSITQGATKIGDAIRARRKKEKEALLEEEAVERISQAVTDTTALEKAVKDGDSEEATKGLQKVLGSFKTTDELKTFLTTRKAFSDEKSEIDKIGAILLRQSGILEGTKTKIPDAPKEEKGLLEEADLRLESVTSGGAKAFSAKGLRGRKEIEAKVEIDKQIAAQAGKAQEKTSRDFFRVGSAVDRTMDSAFLFGERQLEITGTKPGAALGIIDKLTPEQINEYKAGWIGAGREAAATVGRFLISGARGVNLTSVFAKSTATIGNTIEGNAFNVANTNGNLFATALSTNMVVNEAEGNLLHLQDLIEDEVTGEKISELGFKEKGRAINAAAAKLVREQQRHTLTQAFLRNPRLLENRTVVKLMEEAPEFKTGAEADAAVDSGLMMRGTLVKVNGRVGVANGSVSR